MKDVFFLKKIIAFILIQSLVFSCAVWASGVKVSGDIDKSLLSSELVSPGGGLRRCSGLVGWVPSHSQRAWNSGVGEGCLDASFSSTMRDTVETYEIEFEEENGKSRIKEIAAFVVIVAVVGYVVIVLMQPDDEEQATTPGSGKPVPFNRVPVFSLSF